MSELTELLIELQVGIEEYKVLKQADFSSAVATEAMDIKGTIKKIIAYIKRICFKVVDFIKNLIRKVLPSKAKDFKKRYLNVLNNANKEDIEYILEQPIITAMSAEKFSEICMGLQLLPAKLEELIITGFTDTQVASMNTALTPFRIQIIKVDKAFVEVKQTHEAMTNPKEQIVKPILNSTAQAKAQGWTYDTLHTACKLLVGIMDQYASSKVQRLIQALDAKSEKLINRYMETYADASEEALNRIKNSDDTLETATVILSLFNLANGFIDGLSKAQLALVSLIESTIISEGISDNKSNAYGGKNHGTRT